MVCYSQCFDQISLANHRSFSKQMLVVSPYLKSHIPSLLKSSADISQIFDGSVYVDNFYLDT